MKLENDPRVTADMQTAAAESISRLLLVGPVDATTSTGELVGNG